MLVQSKTTKQTKVDTVATADDIIIPISESPKGLSWRLVHDGSKVLDLFESEGHTWTKNTLFVGTEEECLKEIENLGLEPLPVVESVAVDAEVAIPLPP